MVADPGFANAELKRVNESYGFDDDDSLYIYDVTESSTANLDLEKNNTNNVNIKEIISVETICNSISAFYNNNYMKRNKTYINNYYLLHI